MTSLRLALSELKRMSSGRLPRLAVAALTLVPLLYGALYLYANWDPYARMGEVRAAIVNLDAGSASDGGDLHVGDDVTENLLEDGSFGWVVLGSAAEAEAGVGSGEYAFALTIPADFSANLASPEDLANTQQALLSVTTNDANNYMVGTFADRLAVTVRDTVAAEVGTQTADALLAGFGDIRTGMVKASDGASELYAGTVTLADGASELSSGAAEVDSGALRLADGARQVNDGAAALADGSAALGDGAARVDDGAADLADGLAALQDKTEGLPAAAEALADGAEKAAAGAELLAPGAASVADGTEQLAADLPAQMQALQDAGAAHVSRAIATLVGDGTLTQAQAAALSAQITANRQASAAADAMALEGLHTTLDTLAAGARSVSDGAADLNDGLPQLADGSRSLADSAPALADGIASAANGAADLAGGAAALSSGASDVASGAGDLASGTSGLNDGASTLAGGTSALAEGAQGLADGSTTLEDGAGSLSEGLADGADEVPGLTDGQREQAAATIGDPVAVDTIEQASAGVYGEGMAPFFLALALWIGVFALAQVMRPITLRALASNASSLKIALGGWLPFLLLSAAQATVLYAVVLFGLGLAPAHPWMVWGLLLLTSLAFSAIIQGVIALLGTPGKLLVLVLLVLQLVSAGGTFPWETAPAPLHVAHQWLPMSYIVSGMRHLMYGADLSVMGPVVLALLGFTAFGLALSILAVRRNKTWTLKALHPELSS